MYVKCTEETLCNRDIVFVHGMAKKHASKHIKKILVLSLVKLLQTNLIGTTRSRHTNNVYLLCNFIL